jgi:hypothetical protein
MAMGYLDKRSFRAGILQGQRPKKQQRNMPSCFVVVTKKCGPSISYITVLDIYRMQANVLSTDGTKES